MGSESDHDLQFSALLDHRGGGRAPALRDIEQAAQLPRLLSTLGGRLGQAPLKELVAEAVGAVERYCIEAALDSTDGNRSAAAKMLGLSRQSLYMKLSRYGIGTD
jgi:DNA-binding NtrC family response regulator